MSVENLSAENRGQTIDLPPRIRRQQCCSFCRNRGHNIRMCNDIRLVYFEIRCSIAVQNMTEADDLYIWINNFALENMNININLIRAFAIKNCRGVTLNTLITVCNYQIARFIFNKYKDNVSEESIENEFVNIVNYLRREPQYINGMLNESAVNMGIIMREILTYRIYRNAAIQALTPEIEQEPIKYQICVKVNNDENENINELCECNICLDEKKIQDNVKLGCNHEFCKDCIIKTLQMNNTNNHPSCAYCRTEIKNIEVRTENVYNEISSYTLLS